MSTGMLVVATVAVFVGAATMRATGMGFALLAAPFLVLSLGAFEGILVANACAVVSALLNVTQVHADVDWGRARWVVTFGLLGVVPGALAVSALPAAPLSILVSVVVLVGLAFAVLADRTPLPNSPLAAAVGGLASGFMNVTAAVGGPGLVIYAKATGWRHDGFAATAQVHFAVLGIASLALKRAFPTLPPIGWLLLGAALAGGLLAGGYVAARIDQGTAMRVVLAIATAGSLASLAQGIAAL